MVDISVENISLPALSTMAYPAKQINKRKTDMTVNEPQGLCNCLNRGKWGAEPGKGGEAELLPYGCNA